MIFFFLSFHIWPGRAPMECSVFTTISLRGTLRLDFVCRLRMRMLLINMADEWLHYGRWTQVLWSAGGWWLGGCDITDGSVRSGDRFFKKKKPGLAALPLSLSVSHTHSCIYAVIESFCYCGAQGNVFLFLSVARIPSLLCLKQRMWFFLFWLNLFPRQKKREQKCQKDDKMGALQSHTLTQSVAMVTLRVTSIWAFPCAARRTGY